MAAVKDKTVSVWGDKVHPKVRILGDGPPVVYLHGGYGPIETELLDELAKSFTVYAPEHPGITAGDEDSYKALDDMWDLVLYYYDLFDKLGLKSPAVVGHSFGGMIAGEIAATDPTRVGKLVLISPLGLWRDDSPIRNYIVTPQTDLPALLFKDQHHPSLKRITLNPEDQQGVHPHHVGARMHRQVHVADTRQGTAQTAASNRGADADRVGQG